ncbi:hypothetical protein BDA99DRAFT_533126 [Phascolomyces articulosus]|uniref:Uncharacterized protein n=1 Tax=Phascolomyces articulosus TaxID=60185 RepID=A0AAD5K8I5_9FUNG|nr:hypothetical protein BDA99DRAFT_533126 [Phascolomyces articulosus]
MDPGQSHLERLKKVPNLIDEDPSVITPAQQKGYMNMPWKEFSAMMQKNNKENAQKCDKFQNQQKSHTAETSRTTSSSGTPAIEEGENEGAWDSETGYQDEGHAAQLHQRPQ